jgi:hypothetical protein
VNDNFDARRQKAFDVVGEATKQLIAVATGIIAFTVTFSKDFVANARPAFKWLAVVAWILYFVSVAFGLGVLYALSGQLEPGSTNNEDAQEKSRGDGEATDAITPSIWADSVNYCMQAQHVCFVIGLLLTLIFAVCTLYWPGEPDPAKTSNAPPTAPSRP